MTDRLFLLHIMNSAVAAGMGSKEAGKQLDKIQAEILDQLNGQHG